MQTGKSILIFGLLVQVVKLQEKLNRNLNLTMVGGKSHKDLF